MADFESKNQTFNARFTRKIVVGGSGSGEDGFSPTVDVVSIENGHRLIITDKNGTDRVDILNGKDGINGIDGKDGYTPQKGIDYFDGKDGKTPVKGEDYYTEADKAEIVTEVINALPKYNGEVMPV